MAGRRAGSLRDHTCIRNGEIVCFDDLCHGTSRTLCGLEEGIDFGMDDDDLYDWGDDIEERL